MPWCDSCESWLAPATLGDDRGCPKCGAKVEVGPAEGERTVGESAPWHFWLVVAALAGYLFWRAIDGLILLVT